MINFYYFYFVSHIKMTDNYYYYCQAADELNKNWESYTDETMYPDIWKHFTDKFTYYYIYLDMIGEFIFNDNNKILKKFSKSCRKINWD